MPRRGVDAARLAELEAELARVRRQLKTTKTELRSTRSHLREASYNLPDEVESVVTRVAGEHLSFLKPDYLRDLATLVRDVDDRQIPGLIIEAGTALGGSAIVMAAAKRTERPMRVYDVFGLIPPPTDDDGEDVHRRYAKIASGDARGLGDGVYYGYHDDLLAEVSESFSRLGVPAAENNVSLVKGLFQDTVVVEEPVALAHLDGDWYDSTMTCLTRIAPHLSPGGRIVLDDYYAWSGCRKAVDDYFKDRDGFRLVKRAKLHVIKE